MTKELSSPTDFSAGTAPFLLCGAECRTAAGLMDAGKANGGESRYLPQMDSFRRLTAAKAAISTNWARIARFGGK
jgi:hypothetical protein